MGLSRKVSGIRASVLELSAIFLKTIKHYTRYPAHFLIFLALPFLFSALIFGMGRFVGGGNAELNFAARTGTGNIMVYEMLGSAVWMTSWIVIEDVGVSLRNEQIKGTLEQNFLAPINRFVLLVGLSFADIVITGAIFLVVVGVAIGLTAPSSLPTLLQAFILLLIGLVPLFGISFLFAGVVIKFKEPYIFVQIVNLLFASLTGTYYPVTFLPYWVQFISRILPQTYVIRDMREVVLANQTLVTLYGSIFILLTLALLYPIVGYAAFKQFEKRAGVSGELAKY